LKKLANIPDEVDILDAAVIEPIQRLKVETFGSVNPRLHTDEILIALSMSAVTNPTAKIAMEKLPMLRDTDAHATVIISETDTRIIKKLGIRLTTEPIYETKKLYRN
jgi:uncharacterized protein (UPF0371 family)